MKLVVLPSAVVLAWAACTDAPSLEELHRRGYLELSRGRPEAAQASAEAGRRRARARRDAAAGAMFSVLHAEALVDQGRNAEALTLLDTTLASGEGRDSVVARALMTRGRVQCLGGGESAGSGPAQADLAAAARIAARLESPALAAEVARHRGTCAAYRGDHDEAESLYQESLVLARRHELALMEARAAGNLGFLRVRARRYDEATDWLIRALDLATRLHAELDVVKALTNLGWCYYMLGDYERALSFLSRAESMTSAPGYEGERAYALQNLGNVHYQRRALDEAGGYYRRALELARKLDNQRLAAELLSNLGIVSLDQGRYDAAEEFVREAIEIKAASDDQRAIQYSRLAEGQIWQGRGDYERAEALYRDVLRSTHTGPELRWETRASLAGLRIAQDRPAEAEEEFRRAFAVMEELRAELGRPDHRISFFSSLGRFYDDYVAFLVDGGRVQEALEAADRSRARLLRERLGARGAPRSATVRQLQETARALDAVLLFYWTARERSFLWTVTPVAVTLHPLPGEDEIRERVAAHQELIRRSRDLLAERAPATEWLYRSLVEPAGLAAGGGGRVVIVPDGPLHQVNFETLVVSSPAPHYWIEDVTLATAPSLALLAEKWRRAPPRDRALIIGDPLPAAEEFPRLAHALSEVEEVAGQFAPSERAVYTGANAEPGVYRAAEPGRYSFIHFAAHAKANPQVPLDSAVILSPRNDDYKLYAREIVEVPIQAELVTLSACRSAGSRTYAGEGLVGLAWAFLSAGAGNVIAGLWNVEDASTSELMGSLYRELERGRVPAEALRAAKLQLLRSGTPYRKPYYWAPFIVYTQRASDPRHPAHSGETAAAHRPQAAQPAARTAR